MGSGCLGVPDSSTGFSELFVLSKDEVMRLPQVQAMQNFNPIFLGALNPQELHYLPPEHGTRDWVPIVPPPLITPMLGGCAQPGGTLWDLSSHLF